MKSVCQAGKLNEVRGSGITHSEFNLLDQRRNLSNLDQPNELGIKPRYEQKAFDTSKGKTLILSPNAEQEFPPKVYQDMRATAV